tara:strand:- start:80 stop:280 length:201 start_codon:yes stop_codon:yes gene_type:complete
MSDERKIMVQYITNLINAFRFPAFPINDNFDNVDPNLVRYFRTEYSRDWQGALNEHLHKLNQKGLK